MHKYTKQFTKRNRTTHDILVRRTVYLVQKTIFIMLCPARDGNKIGAFEPRYRVTATTLRGA